MLRRSFSDSPLLDPPQHQAARVPRRNTIGSVRCHPVKSGEEVVVAKGNRWRDALLFGLVVLVIAGLSPVITVYDSRWTIPTAVSVERHGDLNLDEYGGAIAYNDRYAIQTVNGHEYDVFPWGTAVLLTPVVFVADKAASIVGIDLQRYADDARQTGKEQRVLRLLEHALASVLVAITAAFIFLTARELASRRNAFIAAAIFAFGTSAWSVLSRALWGQTMATLAVTVALYIAVRARTRPKLLSWLGTPVAVAYICRPTASITLIAFAVYIAARGPRILARFVASGALVGVPFVIVNLATYHDVLPPYFRASRLGNGAFFQALAGTVVSPSRGLFVFSPVLLFAIVGVVLKLRMGRLDGLDMVAVAVTVGTWVTVSSFPQWWGGATYGPRLMADVLPYLCYLLIPAIAWLTEAPAGRLAWARFAFVALAVFSVTVHFRGAVDRKTLGWNTVVDADTHPQRLWDWNDSQILYGL